jgi:hypothetical protein
MGFHIDEKNISVLSPDLEKVLIWQNESQQWVNYDKTHNYPVEIWQGYSGKPFEISFKKKSKKSSSILDT